MYQSSLGTNVLRCSFGDDVRAARFVPLRFDLETGEITCSRTVFCLHWSRHVGRSPLSMILCATSVFSVVVSCLRNNNHRDTENTEVAQRSFILLWLSTSPTLKNLR